MSIALLVCVVSRLCAPDDGIEPCVLRGTNVARLDSTSCPRCFICIVPRLHGTRIAWYYVRVILSQRSANNRRSESLAAFGILRRSEFEKKDANLRKVRGWNCRRKVNAEYTEYRVENTREDDLSRLCAAIHSLALSETLFSPDLRSLVPRIRDLYLSTLLNMTNYKASDVEWRSPAAVLFVYIIARHFRLIAVR